MELRKLGHEQNIEQHYTIHHSTSGSLTRHSARNGDPDTKSSHSGNHTPETGTHISRPGYDTRIETRSVDSLPPLERPLTIGGEPNPDAPHTPEPVSEPPEDRKELSPPGILSWEAIALLAPFGLLGLLARLGITAIATYANQATFSLAWVQAAGCFVMGIAQYQKPFIMSFYPPLYLGITTGFCGSLTTFSGWQRDVFLSWLDPQGAGLSNWQRFLDGATRLLFTQAISMASFLLGKEIGRQDLRLKLEIPKRTVRGAILMFSILAYAACFPAFFLLSPDYRGAVTAALLFSFPGVVTRHLLGTVLNHRMPSFPIGTFASNILGTAISAMSYVLQHIEPVVCHSAGVAILQGIVDGYTGCLSTVSTYAAEINVMNRRHAWRYTLVSWLTAQVILVLVIGSAKWSGAFQTSTDC